MDTQEVIAKLTAAIEISDKASIYNPSFNEEMPDLPKALDMIDNIIVDVLMGLDPDWERP